MTSLLFFFPALLALTTYANPSMPGLSRSMMNQMMTGTLQVLSGQSVEQSALTPDKAVNTASVVEHLYLKEQEGRKTWSLKLPAPMAAMADYYGPASYSNLSGKTVSVHYTHQEGHILHLSRGPEEMADTKRTPAAISRRLLSRSSHRSLSQSSTWLSTFGAPTGSVSMIIFIMDLSTCNAGMPPATTPQAVMSFLSGDPHVPDGISLSGMYDACTMGQLSLNATSSIALNIPFPCNGTQLDDGTVFTMSTCNNNVLPWQEYAAQQAAILMPGIDMNQFQHRVLILPVIMTSVVEGCNFGALGSQGRWGYDTAPQLGNAWGYGLVWLCGDCWNWTAVYFHELGHNYGMQHARSQVAPFVGDTLDSACSMTSWAGEDARCYNAPHMWLAGWSQPSIQLDMSTQLPLGAPAQLITVAMQPADGARGSTGLYIAVNSSTAYSVSYRGTLPPYERPFMFLQAGLLNGVFIHRLPSGVVTTDTAMVAMLTFLGDSWTDPDTLLSASLVSSDSASAVVAVCTRMTASESCFVANGAQLISLPASPPQAPPPAEPPIVPSIIDTAKPTQQAAPTSPHASSPYVPPSQMFPPVTLSAQQPLPGSTVYQPPYQLYHTTVTTPSYPPPPSYQLYHTTVTTPSYPPPPAYQLYHTTVTTPSYPPPPAYQLYHTTATTPSYPPAPAYQLYHMTVNTPSSYPPAYHPQSPPYAPLVPAPPT
ncbi:hypothetical protein CEUSTIGMA_g3047.t1 [Chlamydomonas eustigma]|uniref:Peptidase M11 gametolysin domain-containing protein n=1 Tax=Chlamydomonas eustigma TaxID=1157962 RepID=A0A250WXN9_9CHLO|nr:hypothetical protein CEUSTIGMA_g3047.t1 [Chlamydomonas eustigma]|eukprot:GAX75603.1 hypothetical protein CEUSTIGMA_g3047.t1 [Chlamydomonas eustigma]